MGGKLEQSLLPLLSGGFSAWSAGHGAFAGHRRVSYGCSIGF